MDKTYGYEEGPDGFWALLVDSCRISFFLMGVRSSKSPPAGGIFLPPLPLCVLERGKLRSWLLCLICVEFVRPERT